MRVQRLIRQIGLLWLVLACCLPVQAEQHLDGIVQAAAQQTGVPVSVIRAVIQQESAHNPGAVSHKGAQGLMQIIPRFHQDKVPPAAGEQPFLDPLTNVRIGARILQEAIQRQGSLIDGLQYYAGAADDEDKTYASKIMAERLRLEPTARLCGLT